MMSNKREMSSWLSRCHDDQTNQNHRNGKGVDEDTSAGSVGVAVAFENSVGLFDSAITNFSDDENEDENKDIIGSLLTTCEEEMKERSPNRVSELDESTIIAEDVKEKLKPKKLIIKVRKLDENFGEVVRESHNLKRSKGEDTHLGLLNLKVNGFNEIDDTCSDVDLGISSKTENDVISTKYSESTYSQDMLIEESDLEDKSVNNSSAIHSPINDEDATLMLLDEDDENSRHKQLIESTEEELLHSKKEGIDKNLGHETVTVSKTIEGESCRKDGGDDKDTDKENKEGTSKMKVSTNITTVENCESRGRKRRFRKQHTPRCLKHLVSLSDESEYELAESEDAIANVNGFTTSDNVHDSHIQIKKVPFCSKLRKPKKYRTRGATVPNTKCTDIWTIINHAFEKNMPEEKESSNHRYPVFDNRHQIIHELLEKDLDTLKDDQVTVVEPRSPENGSMVDETEHFPEISVKEFMCNVCFKSFDDAKDFASHYLLHTVKEKEKVFLKFNEQLEETIQRKPKKEHGGGESHRSCKVKAKETEVKVKRDEKIKTEPDESSTVPFFKGLWDALDLSQFKSSGPLVSLDLSNCISISDNITYICHVCNKKFTNILDLQQHMTEHDTQDSDDKMDSSSEHNFSPCLKSPLTRASVSPLTSHNKFVHGENKLFHTNNNHSDNKDHISDKKVAQDEAKSSSSNSHPYTCHTCLKTFRDKTRLTTHVRVHTGEKPYQCHVCLKSFSQKGNLKLHQKIHTGEKDCHCGICRHSFRSKSDLNRHLKVHGVEAEDKDSSSVEGMSSRQSTPSVDDCQSPVIETPLEAFLRRDNRPASIRPSTIRSILEENDIPVHPSIALLSNKSETYSLAQLENLELLTSAASKNFRFLQPMKYSLGHYYSQRDKLREHNSGYSYDVAKKDWLPLKPEEKNLMLSIDNEVEFIKAMTNAKTASEDESKSQTFPCPLCSSSLTSYDSLNHHILSIHGPLMSPLYPPLRLMTPDDLREKASVMSQSSKKLYRCQECQMEFSSFTVFQCHLKTHSDSPQHKRTEEKCLICGQYVNLGDLGDHMMAHAIEKTYKCEFCMKVFRRSHHLQTHLRTHTGDRPYVCLECNKRFSRGDHLQNHKRTHTGNFKAGEKPYQCDICYKTYSQSHHLLRHKRTHTGEGVDCIDNRRKQESREETHTPGERPYKCVMCDKTFSRDHHLKKHMETHKVLMFTDKAPNVPLQKPTSSKPLSSRSFVPSTSSAGRTLEQMIESELRDPGRGMVPMLMENSASRLMERLVKKRMEEDKKDGRLRQDAYGSEILDLAPIKRRDDARNDVKSFESIEDKDRERSKLKIADLLADVDSHVPAEISSKLVANHLLKITQRSKVRLDTPKGDDVDRKTISKTCKKLTEERTVAGKQNDITNFAKVFNESADEKMTLEDIVNRKLMQEYGLII